jgi:hypothetical protein
MILRCQKCLHIRGETSPYQILEIIPIICAVCRPYEHYRFFNMGKENQIHIQDHIKKGIYD